MNIKNALSKKMALLLSLIFGLAVSSAIWVYANEYLSVSKSSTKIPKVSKESAASVAQSVFDGMKPGSKVTSLQLKERIPSDQPLWEALSDRDSETWINANNGEVRFVFDGESSADAVNNAKTTPLPTLTKEQALSSIRKATSKLRLFVPSSEPFQAELLSHGDTDRHWNFKWARVERGYKYHDDWIFIFADAYKGQIIGYNKNFISNTPASFEVRIQKERALELAKEFAADKNFKLVPEKLELMIVNPNYRWTDKMNKVPSIDTRLSWVIGFTKHEGSGEIWIDVKTGEMLGGEESR